ncbi:MAG TPA: hypothetical protein VEQ60_06285 [Longimicrobium sp.]|nr:hypothetical protein [Longimicrobium sp.]
MEYSTAERYEISAWVQLIRLLLLPAFPAAAVLVARHRPAWLLRAWLATAPGWRRGGCWWNHLIWFPYDLEAVPGVAAVGIAMVGVLTGPPALWPYPGRRHSVFSRLAVQLVGAVAALAGGMALVAFVATLG